MFGFKLKFALFLSLFIATFAIADEDGDTGFDTSSQDTTTTQFDSGPVPARPPTPAPYKKNLTQDQIFKSSLQDGKTTITEKDNRLERWAKFASRGNVLEAKPYNPPERKIASFTEVVTPQMGSVVEQEIPANIPKRSKLKESITREVATGLRQANN